MHITLEKTKSQSTSKTSVCNVMTMSVSRYHEFDYWFDCWEILPGQLGNKLLIQWWLASVAGIWKERERGFGHERNAKSEAKEGVISTFTWWTFIMQKTIVSWQAFPSLLPSLFCCTKNPLFLPFEILATQAKWSHYFNLFTSLHWLIYIKQFAYFGGLR